MGSARTSEYELVGDEPRNWGLSERGLQAPSSGSAATAPTVNFDDFGDRSSPLRYNVRIQVSTAAQSGIVGINRANTPQPFLGPLAPFPYGTASAPRAWESSAQSDIVGSTPQHSILGPLAPFPYGTASLPRTWEPRSRRTVYLSVPPLYDSDKGPQVDQQQSPHCVDNDESYPGASFRQHSNPSPMSLKRRLEGCFCASMLGLFTVFFVFHVGAFYFIVQIPTFPLFLMGGINLSILVLLVNFVVSEAHRSPLGKLLAAEQVEVDGVAEFLGRLGADKAPVVDFLASNQQRRRRQRWLYDHHESVSPPSEDVVSHVHHLSSTHEVVRLRLGVEVVLADNQTRGDFMTALHSFYMEALPHSISVRMLDQDHTVAVTQDRAGFPISFRVLRVAFMVSTCLTISWILRIVVLLFFPRLVDPAFSPVFRYQKRLVSRPTSA